MSEIILINYYDTNNYGRIYEFLINHIYFETGLTFITY